VPQLAACLHNVRLARGHAGCGPLLCGLMAHSGAVAHDRVARLGAEVAIYALGVAATSEMNRQCSELTRQRSKGAARLSGDSRRYGDLRRRRAVSSVRLSMKTWRRSGLPGQRQGRRRRPDSGGERRLRTGRSERWRGGRGSDPGCQGGRTRRGERRRLDRPVQTAVPL
jgi:hypothetical protein